MLLSSKIPFTVNTKEARINDFSFILDIRDIKLPTVLFQGQVKYGTKVCCYHESSLWIFTDFIVEFSTTQRQSRRDHDLS